MDWMLQRSRVGDNVTDTWRCIIVIVIVAIHYIVRAHSAAIDSTAKSMAYQPGQSKLFHQQSEKQSIPSFSGFDPGA